MQKSINTFSLFYYQTSRHIISNITAAVAAVLKAALLLWLSMISPLLNSSRTGSLNWVENTLLGLNIFVTQETMRRWMYCMLMLPMQTLHCFSSSGQVRPLVLHFLSYTPVVQQKPVTVRTGKKWCDGAMDCLRDSLETTDWLILYDSHGDHDDHPYQEGALCPLVHPVVMSPIQICEFKFD